MKTQAIRESYTAASAFPLKVVLNDAVKDGKIVPLHIQFNPTNQCNLDCSFCSCSNRDKSEELDIELAKFIIDVFKSLGTISVTITGGGEPLMYPEIEELINYFDYRDIKVGIVTNGLLIYKISSHTLRKITWCRISHSDYRQFTDAYAYLLRDPIERVGIDWAFSYVVSENPDYENIRKMVEFANENDFTHIRLVSDLFIVESVPMGGVIEYLNFHNVDDSRVIYQPRRDYTAGGPCYICYLKPVIGPDGKLYTCCGAQYALPENDRLYPERLCIGDALNIRDIIEHSNKPFDGSICVKCYYKPYNDLLSALLKNLSYEDALDLIEMLIEYIKEMQPEAIKHREFV